MSGAAILRAARAAGVNLRVDGDGLVLQAHAPPPPEILEALARYKQEIIGLLRPGRDGWSAEDWQAHLRAFSTQSGRAEQYTLANRPQRVHHARSRAVIGAALMPAVLGLRGVVILPPVEIVECGPPDVLRIDRRDRLADLML